MIGAGNSKGTQISQKAQKWSHHRWQGYGVAYRREIERKSNSKLFNGPAEMKEMAEILGPSQMAGDRAHGKHGNHRKEAITDGDIWESPEGEKLQENLIQNYTKYKGSASEGVN